MNERTGKILAVVGASYMFVGYNLQLISEYVYTIENFDKIYSIGVLCFCLSILNLLHNWVWSYIIASVALNACLDECLFNPSVRSWSEWIEATIIILAITAYFNRSKWMDKAQL